jgi:hypothetical protein
MYGLAFVKGDGKPTFLRTAIADKMTSMNAIYHVLRLWLPPSDKASDKKSSCR